MTTMFDTYSLEDLQILIAKATVFRIAPRLTVEKRTQKDGIDLWCVNNQGFVLASDGEWESEGLSSSRTDEFIARTRFPFDVAYNMAMDATTDQPDHVRRTFYNYEYEIPPRRKPNVTV